MKQMKNLKKITVLLTMILCIFSVMSFSSVKASAATNVGVARDAYLRTYSNGCTEAYMTIFYESGSRVTTSTNISWLVRRGSNSNSIKMLQASLNRVMIGYEKLSVDGSWGPKTESTLKAYQAWRLGKGQDDGICGPATWRKLINDIYAWDHAAV